MKVGKFMSRLAFDMDDVIADTYSAQLVWLGETYPDMMKYADGRKFVKFLSKLQHDNFLNMLTEGIFFGDLDPMKGAIETLEALNKKHELFIVTAATLFPNSCVPKINWIKKHLPFFNLKNVVFCMNKSVAQVDYLVDDHSSNFKGLKGKGMLFTAAHNLNDSYPMRLNDWTEVARFFD